MRSHFRLRSRRGSILIVALIFAMVVAIGLVSQLRLATTALTLSDRSLLNNNAMNLAESGLEQALWSFNQSVTSGVSLSTAWNGWSIDGNNASRTFNGFPYLHGAIGAVRVYVQNYNSTGIPVPVVVSRAAITPASGAPLVKEVEVNLQRRSLFSTGMVGRNGISFSGSNASADSWNSDPDNNPGTAAVPYDATVRADRATLAALNLTATIATGNAVIWGYASVGGSSTSTISVGANGTIGPFGTAAGVIDATHVAANFIDNLPLVSAPSPILPNVIASVTSTVTLPRLLDVMAADGKYYYSIGSISEASSDTITIAANKNVVICVLPGGNINVTGNAGINIVAGSSLAIYGAGDIKIGGNGIANANTQPISCQIWGTNSTVGGQAIEVRGNGSLDAVVYAPNANVKINGNGDVMGSIVGNTVTLTGNAAFHYDEALANWGPNTPFRLSKWRELVSAGDRAVYAAATNF